MTENTHELVHRFPRDADLGESFAALAAAQQAVLPRKLEDGGLYAVLNGDRIELVETPGFTDNRDDARADLPRRIIRSVTVADEDSLINYLIQNTIPGQGDNPGGAPYSGVGGMEVWADLDNRTVTAILDGVDGWRGQTAQLKLRHSREWDEWARIDGKLYAQTEFAQFIEDHISTIASPDGAQLLDICQTLQAHTNVDFKQSTILANGQRQFRFEETLEARAGQRGDLTIPGELTLVLRPFTGSAPVAIQARFRYRLADGRLTLGVRLAEPDKAIEEAFDGVVASVADRVPVPVLFGRP